MAPGPRDNLRWIGRLLLVCGFMCASTGLLSALHHHDAADGHQDPNCAVCHQIAQAASPLLPDIDDFSAPVPDVAGQVAPTSDAPRVVTPTAPIAPRAPPLA